MYTFNDIDNRLPGGDRQTDRDREKVCCCCVVAVSRKRENGGARSRQKLNVSRREKTQHLMIFPFFFFKRCISSFLSAHLAAPKQDNSARDREKEKRGENSILGVFSSSYFIIFFPLHPPDFVGKKFVTHRPLLLSGKLSRSNCN